MHVSSLDQRHQVGGPKTIPASFAPPRNTLEMDGDTHTDDTPITPPPSLTTTTTTLRNRHSYSLPTLLSLNTPSSPPSSLRNFPEIHRDPLPSLDSIDRLDSTDVSARTDLIASAILKNPTSRRALPIKIALTDPVAIPPNASVSASCTALLTSRASAAFQSFGPTGRSKLGDTSSIHRSSLSKFSAFAPAFTPRTDTVPVPVPVLGRPRGPSSRTTSEAEEIDPSGETVKISLPSSLPARPPGPLAPVFIKRESAALAQSMRLPEVKPLGSAWDGEYAMSGNEKRRARGTGERRGSEGTSSEGSEVGEAGDGTSRQGRGERLWGNSSTGSLVEYHPRSMSPSPASRPSRLGRESWRVGGVMRLGSVEAARPERLLQLGQRLRSGSVDAQT